MQWLTNSPGTWLLLVLATLGLFSAMGNVLRRPGQDGGDLPLTILVLVQNQASHIEWFVRSLTDLLRGHTAHTDDVEMLMIDLASEDETVQILERLAREDRWIQLVHLPADRRSEALDTSLVLCRNRVSLLVDLRGKVDMPDVLRSLRSIW